MGFVVLQHVSSNLKIKYSVLSFMGKIGSILINYVDYSGILRKPMTPTSLSAYLHSIIDDLAVKGFAKAQTSMSLPDEREIMISFDSL